MHIDLKHAGRRQLEAAARHYEEHGFLLVRGVDDLARDWFRPILARELSATARQMDEILDPETPVDIFPQEVRQRLARVPTSADHAHALLETLGPLLARLIGPL